MKVIEIPQDSPEINELLEQARCDDLLLRATDGTEFMLTTADNSDDEIERMRKNERLMALLDERGKQPATIPLEDIKRELGLS
jgi:hypothetical protein